MKGKQEKEKLISQSSEEKKCLNMQKVTLTLLLEKEKNWAKPCRICFCLRKSVRAHMRACVCDCSGQSTQKIPEGTLDNNYLV